MKHKAYRPEPLKANPFFFEHLPTSQAVADDMREMAETVVSSSSSTPPSPTSTWSVAPETGNENVDRILWNAFTPESYRKSLKALLDVEDTRRQTFEAMLTEKWEQVEEVLQLNRQRRANLSSSTDLLGEIDEMRFWTAQDVVSRFAIDVTVGARTEDEHPHTEDVSPAAVASESDEYADLTHRSRITLDYSVAPPAHTQPSHDAPPKDKSEPGMHHAKAWAMSDEVLLDYTRRPHHLRRLFAPLLQRRDELPKNLTLLLNELQVVQSQRLPRMEQQVEDETMFTVPIYLPLQMIASFMNRHLISASENETVEADRVQKARAMGQAVEAFQKRMIAIAPDEETVAAMGTEQRDAVAQDLWMSLFRELEQHRDYHEETIAACESMETAARAAVETMRAALQSCAAASRQAMHTLEQDAAQCTAALTATGSRALEVMDEVEARYQQDAERLDQSMRAKQVALEKSEAAQEKLLRRVREAVKEVYLEQFRYEELVQEWLQEQLTLKHLDASYQQVKAVMQTRHAEAVNACQHAERVHALLREAEEVRQGLLTACEQHIGRLETEEFYRRCHVANQVVTNVQQWSRAVGDVAHLYEGRYATVAGRLTNANWQMEYLLASERDWAVGNLLDVREDLVTVDERWKEAMALASELTLFADNAVPSLNQESRSERTVEARSAMRRLDDSKQVQRSVMTLKTYRTRHAAALPENAAVPSYAAGSGVSAALRLARAGDTEALRHT